MDSEGPALETLTRRLAETPEEFLAEPRVGAAGRVHTAAVVGDLLQLLGSTAAAGPDLARFTGGDARRDRNRLAVTLVLCWLLADEWFRRARPPARLVMSLLDTEAAELARHAVATAFVTDPDRREELARLTLARL